VIEKDQHDSKDSRNRQSPITNDAESFGFAVHPSIGEKLVSQSQIAIELSFTITNRKSPMAQSQIANHKLRRANAG
jgi:hypothetical protein